MINIDLEMLAFAAQIEGTEGWTDGVKDHGVLNGQLQTVSEPPYTPLLPLNVLVQISKVCKMISFDIVKIRTSLFLTLNHIFQHINGQFKVTPP